MKPRSVSCVAMLAAASLALTAACSGAATPSPSAAPSVSTAPVASTPPSVSTAPSGAVSSAPAASTAAASPAAQLKLVQPGVLTVATYGNGFPTIVVNSDGTLGGTDGAWLNDFAKAHNLQVKLFETTFTSAILAVEQGKADITLDIYYTPARSHQLYYTYPNNTEGLQVFTQKSLNYTGPASLTGKKVASVTGIIWDTVLKAAFGSNLQLFPTEVAGETALINGQVAAYFDSVAQYFAPPFNKSPNIAAHEIIPGQFGISSSLINVYGYNVVGCSEQSLAAALDDELTSLETSGQWATILQQAGVPAGTLFAKVPARQLPPENCGK